MRVTAGAILWLCGLLSACSGASSEGVKCATLPTNYHEVEGGGKPNMVGLAGAVSYRIHFELHGIPWVRAMPRRDAYLLLSDSAFDYTGCYEEDCALKAGRFLGVDWVLLSATTMAGDTITIEGRLFDVNKGTFISEAQKSGLGEGMPQCSKVARQMVFELVAGRPDPTTEPDAYRPISMYHNSCCSGVEYRLVKPGEMTSRGSPSVMICSVEQEGVRAGLRSGDLVVEFAGDMIGSLADMAAATQKLQKGVASDALVIREQKQLRIRVLFE